MKNPRKYQGLQHNISDKKFFTIVMNVAEFKRIIMLDGNECVSNTDDRNSIIFRADSEVDWNQVELEYPDDGSSNDISWYGTGFISFDFDLKDCKIVFQKDIDNLSDYDVITVLCTK